MNLFAADVGGTNSRLIFATSSERGITIESEKIYPSSKYPDFISVVVQFLTDFSISSSSIGSVCIAVAGPVKSGTASVTNLPWVLSEKELGAFFQTDAVCLINDFAGIALGIPELPSTQLITLQSGQADSDTEPADFVVIGAGTGLGAAYVTWEGDHYRPHTSEAGHAGFAPENHLQAELLSFLLQNYNYVSLEMVLSGSGLINIYTFMQQKLGLPYPSTIQKALQEDHSDLARLITECAIQHNDPLCTKTLECFVEIYGSAASDLVLQHYPVHQLYIAGGIALKIPEYMQQTRFIDAFNNKGKMVQNMRHVSIKMVLEEKVGLYGALGQARYLVSN